MLLEKIWIYRNQYCLCKDIDVESFTGVIKCYNVDITLVYSSLLQVRISVRDVLIFYTQVYN